MRLLKARSNIRFFLVLVLGVVIAFQACSGEQGPPAKSVPLQNNSGNGGGYGGKLQPGRYYALTPNAPCSTRPGSDVAGIIHVETSTKITYYAGCEEIAGHAITESDLDVSAANASIIGFETAKMNFEWMDQFPTGIGMSDYIEAVCYFGPSSTYLSAQVVLRRGTAAAPATHLTEIHYTKLALDSATGFSEHSVPPFTSQFDGSDPARSRYMRSSAPLFDLQIEGNGFTIFNPVSTGRATAEIEGQTMTLDAYLCLFNRPPR